MTSERQVWERLEGEGRKAFEAFATYREMGTARSNAKVARQLGKSKTLIDRWSGRWKWTSRMDAYNDHLDRETLRINAEDLRETQRRHRNLAQIALSKFLERLAGLAPDDIPVAVLDRLLKVGTEVELRALGWSEKHAVELAGPDGGPIPFEQQVDMDKLLADPEARKALETLAMSIEAE